MTNKLNFFEQEKKKETKKFLKGRNKKEKSFGAKEIILGGAALIILAKGLEVLE